jgi:hypothetical protein
MTTYLIEEKGLFWWSDNAIEDNIAPDGGIYGTLTVNDRGVIKLELDHLMPSNEDNHHIYLSEQLPITRSISGILKATDQYVILSNLWRSGGHRKSHALSYDEYGAWTCLVSHSPLDRTGAIPKFRNMTIPLVGYEVWMGFGSLDIKATRNHVKVGHKRSGNHTFKLPDRTVRLRYGVDGPRSSFFTNQATYKTFGAFDFTFKKNCSLDEIIKHHKRFEDLLIILSNIEHDLAWPIVSTFRKSQGATLYFRRDRRKDVKIDRHECWIALPQIIASFESILGKWEEKSDLLGPGIFMYSSTRRGIKLFIENEFNNLIVGLEAFDRVLYPVKEDAEHQAKLDRIIDAVDKKDASWLKSKLQRSGDPNLQTRLIRVLTALPLGISKKRLARFALRCQGFRNKIAHEGGYTNTAEQSALMTDLRNIFPGLSALYHARILKEIGIDDNIIKNIFSNSFGSTGLQIWLFTAGLLDADPRKETMENVERAIREHQKLHRSNQDKLA